eukprot:gnl/TRDRNA2_/TRDRNA2_84655_c1_seq1.p1 gnl/TRDRNA2_/TRDRNA2_84655_c1~~gnl/TRDRNA2_/TRDRNA2_84655_c1_seq1.p1  ORF type:complete len:252 (-),score=56.21 gnl/TRDRNA2_/TRDRNA2_84655_c1_seq1:105-860(-)
MAAGRLSTAIFSLLLLDGCRSLAACASSTSQSQETCRSLPDEAALLQKTMLVEHKSPESPVQVWNEHADVSESRYDFWNTLSKEVAQKFRRQHDRLHDAVKTYEESARDHDAYEVLDRRIRRGLTNMKQLLAFFRSQVHYKEHEDNGFEKKSDRIYTERLGQTRMSEMGSFMREFQKAESTILKAVEHLEAQTHSNRRLEKFSRELDKGLASVASAIEGWRSEIKVQNEEMNAVDVKDNQVKENRMALVAP